MGRLSWWALNAFLLRDKGKPYTHRGEGAMKREQTDLKMLVLKIRVMQPQAKKCWQPLEVDETRNAFFPRASRESMALLDS